MKSYLPSLVLLLVGHSAQYVAVSQLIPIDGPRTVWSSATVLPRAEAQRLERVYPISLNWGVQLNINRFNFRLYIERIQTRNESVALSPRS